VDGLTVLEKIAIGKWAAVLILRPRGAVDDRVKPRTRPDDYLTKPFAFVELLRACACCGGRPTPERLV